MHPLRVAFLGAGSVGFTRKLVHDLVSVPEFADATFALHDISAENLDQVARLLERDLRAARLPARLERHAEARAAMAGCDAAVCTVRVGGLDAFETDIAIPLEFGVDQCVGDTICAGGLMYAQRTIPVLLGFARDFREVAAPGAIFLNYTNPMAMNTWALERHGRIPVLGLCHGVQHAHWQITECVERWAKATGRLAPDYATPGFHKLHRDEVDVVAAGINHQTWFVQVRFRGEDVRGILREQFEAHPRFAAEEKVRIDVLRRFGFYSTESNGHLSEYLPWYRKRRERIPAWTSDSYWIHGRTGGYLAHCREERTRFAAEAAAWDAEGATPLPVARRSEEHGSWILEALRTGRTYRGHFNVRNDGQIPNLPPGCVIEIPGFVDRSGIAMPHVGPLPLGCAATCAASVRVQEMGMEAAVAGDPDLLKLAMLHDPLVGAVCEPAEVWTMTDRLLEAQARWLPQYRRPTTIAVASGPGG